MLLHAKIDQLIILDHSIVVVIIPEDVFHKIGYFCLILLQNPNEELPNFIRLELEISVRVEFYYLAVDHLAHRKGQLLCPELEFLLLETLTLQFDVTPWGTLLLPARRLHLCYHNMLSSIELGIIGHGNEQFEWNLWLCNVWTFIILLLSMKKRDNLL